MNWIQKSRVSGTNTILAAEKRLTVQSKKIITYFHLELICLLALNFTLCQVLLWVRWDVRGSRLGSGFIGSPPPTLVELTSRVWFEKKLLLHHLATLHQLSYITAVWDLFEPSALRCASQHETEEMIGLSLFDDLSTTFFVTYSSTRE